LMYSLPLHFPPLLWNLRYFYCTWTLVGMLVETSPMFQRDDSELPWD